MKEERDSIWSAYVDSFSHSHPYMDSFRDSHPYIAYRDDGDPDAPLFSGGLSPETGVILKAEWKERMGFAIPEEPSGRRGCYVLNENEQGMTPLVLSTFDELSDEVCWELENDPNRRELTLQQRPTEEAEFVLRVRGTRDTPTSPIRLTATQIRD